MIKIFRRIRQRLMTENKFSKYLLYAIGEIVLVVIGILIALQINNWNEKRKDNLKEHTILIQLQEEYISNLRQLEEKMQLRAKIINSGLTVIEYIDAPKDVLKDSMIFHLSNIVYDPTFDPIQNDLVSSGNIRLIRNDRLRQLLSNWTSDIVAVQEQEKVNQYHAHEIILPLFNNLGLTRYVLNELWSNMGDRLFLLDKNTDDPNLILGHSYKKIKVEDIITNIELEGVISSAVSYNKLGNLQSQALKNTILEILELIRAELDGK